MSDTPRDPLLSRPMTPYRCTVKRPAIGRSHRPGRRQVAVSMEDPLFDSIAQIAAARKLSFASVIRALLRVALARQQ